MLVTGPASAVASGNVGLGGPVPTGSPPARGRQAVTITPGAADVSTRPDRATEGWRRLQAQRRPTFGGYSNLGRKTPENAAAAETSGTPGTTSGLDRTVHRAPAAQRARPAARRS
ncbi:hypothetical protein GCM10026982_21400 [Nocardiopsis aegyptia]